MPEMRFSTSIPRPPCRAMPQARAGVEARRQAAIRKQETPVRSLNRLTALHVKPLSLNP